MKREPAQGRYVLALAGVAVAVLGAGSALKPKERIIAAPSPNETATLQRAVRREELRKTAGFFAERAEAIGQQVVYIPERNSAGVLWGRPGDALTAGVEQAGVAPPLAIVQTGQRSAPAEAASDDPAPGRWLLLIGRAPDSQLMWAAALAGGSRDATCNSAAVREVVANTPLSPAFSGAGAFDLDGVLRGVVTRCGDAWRVISTASVPALLKASSSTDSRMMARYGFRAVPMDEQARLLFDDAEGLFVIEARVADSAAVRAGDVLLTLNGLPVRTSQELWDRLAAISEGETVTVTVLRGGRKQALAMNPAAMASPASALGIGVEPPRREGPPLVIAPGTPAWKAGLRTGDRAVQVGAARFPTPAQLRRALASAGESPLLVVFERAGVERAAVVAK